MISVKNLNKTYGEKVVYEDFNINIEKNKILVVLGESGSGKTTLLNVLAGLTDYQGQIIGNLSPISMLFQKDYLVPNLTVGENLKLVNSGVDANLALSSVGLEDCVNSYPKSLSAGMSRRVAILRSLIFNAKLLLMDEPTNSLDIGLKKVVYEMLIKQKNEHGKTIVVVTHDIDEALSLADKIAVLKDGKLIYSHSFESALSERDITGEECNAVRKILIDTLVGNKI